MFVILGPGPGRYSIELLRRGYNVTLFELSPVAEIQSAGFEIITYASPESFAAGMGKALEEIKQHYPSAYENIVSVAVETGSHPAFRDTGEHIHFVVRLNA